MVRPKKLDENLEAQLIELSLQIINNNNGNLPIRELAKSSNVSVGTIYNVFENNDQLTIKVKDKIMFEIYKFIKTNIDKSEGKEPSLVVMSRSFISYIRTYSFQWNYFMSNTSPVEAFPNWYKENINNRLEYLESIIAKESDIPSKELRNTVIVFWSFLQGLSFIESTGKLSLISKESVESLINTFLSRFIPVSIN